METATWNVDVNGGSHEVQLRWTYWGGRREVLVDGDVVAGDVKLLRWKSRHTVDVAGKKCTVITRPQKLVRTAFDIVLDVDGKELAPTRG